MLQITEIVGSKQAQINKELIGLELPYHKRQKCRLRVTLNNGADAALQLKRGHVLSDGELLRAETGELIRVCAAKEDVSTVYADSYLLLARAAYHLGNRHVALQVGQGWLRYLSDHVLDDMVKQLGLTVKQESAPFEPESGAYSAHSHHHAKS